MSLYAKIYLLMVMALVAEVRVLEPLAMPVVFVGLCLLGFVLVMIEAVAVITLVLRGVFLATAKIQQGMMNVDL